MEALLHVSAGAEILARTVEDGNPGFVILVELLRGRQQVCLKLVIDGIKRTGTVESDVTDATFPLIIDDLISSHGLTSKFSLRHAARVPGMAHCSVFRLNSSNKAF